MTLGEFASSFKSSWGAASAAATAGPAALLAAGFSPPWPTMDGRAAAALATLAGLIGLAMAYASGNSPSNRRRSKRALGAAGVLLLAFAASWSWLMQPIPMMDNGVSVERRYVAGVVLSDLAKK